MNNRTPQAAVFFAFFPLPKEGEKASEIIRPTLDRWKELGGQLARLTVVDETYNRPGYPHGLWLEGWTDFRANQLPFGTAEHEGGPIFPPLTAAAKDKP